MSVRRRLAGFFCLVLTTVLPARQRAWGEAIRLETEEIADDAAALAFALDSLRGLLPRAVAARLLHPLSPTLGTTIFEGGHTPMTPLATAARRPRLTGISCAIGAVSLGLLHLALAGAPTRYLVLNAAALVIGLCVLAALVRTPRLGGQWPGIALVSLAGTMLATAMLGDSVEGAARWVKLGSLSVQPSLILLPVMIVLFARMRGGLAALALVAAAAALAIQPDRAMAGMLAASLTMTAILRADRPTLITLGASLAGFAATLSRPDMLPAVPHVDKILYSAFDVHPVAGVAVLGGAALLLLPAVLGWIGDPTNRETYGVFGMIWFAALAAAALGNYPTPLVGYGGSAILGYTLSLLALPKRVATGVGAAHDALPPKHEPSGRRLRIGLA